MLVKSYFTCYEKVYNNRENIWLFVDFRHHCLCSCITLQLWLGMTPSLKSLKGSEQCQDDCTDENFVRKRAVSQIDRKQWGPKRDLYSFYVNTVLQDQTALELHINRTMRKRELPNHMKKIKLRAPYWLYNEKKGSFPIIWKNKFANRKICPAAEIQNDPFLVYSFIENRWRWKWDPETRIMMNSGRALLHPVYT